MDNLILFILGMIVGWAIFKIHFYYKVWVMMKSISESPLPKKPEIKKINIELVKLKDTLYAYNNDTKAFLAHGQSKQEVVDSLHKQYPNHMFMASPANLKEVDLE